MAYIGGGNREVFAGLGTCRPDGLFGGLPTPCYIIDGARIRKNMEILQGLSNRTGARILLAQKAFSNYNLYPLMGNYLCGTAASGLFEARLGHEEMPGREVHVFSAAFSGDEFPEILKYADHIVFNSPAQLRKFGPAAKAAGKSLGLRINPQCSTQETHAVYDPCAPGSRLGVTRAEWDKHMDASLINLLSGLHFHTLCEQDADALKITLDAVNEKFGDILPSMEWLNMGGGHHITRPGYDLTLLEKCITSAKIRWDVEIYLEPGEACALNAGYLASKVLDIVENSGKRTAILDASAACHMPDVLEVPYVPPVWGAEAAENILTGTADVPPLQSASCGFTYTLAGPTCLSGDIIGAYTFPHPLKEGDLITFGDMAIYTTCKNNTFNGMPLPSIYLLEQGGGLRLLRRFSYADFKMRLGSG